MDKLTFIPIASISNGNYCYHCEKDGSLALVRIVASASTERPEVQNLSLFAKGKLNTVHSVYEDDLFLPDGWHFASIDGGIHIVKNDQTSKGMAPISIPEENWIKWKAPQTPNYKVGDVVWIEDLKNSNVNRDLAIISKIDHDMITVNLVFRNGEVGSTEYAYKIAAIDITPASEYTVEKIPVKYEIKVSKR